MKKIILTIMALIISIVSVYLIMRWFGWRLLVVMVLFLWANNLQAKADNL